MTTSTITFKQPHWTPLRTDWRTVAVYRVLSDGESVGYVTASQNSSKTGRSWAAFSRIGKPVSGGYETRAAAAAALVG